MQTQDPRVDRYRGAVYQAEDTIASVMRRPYRAVRLGSRVVTLSAEVRLGSLAGVQAYVDAVLDEPETSARYRGLGPVVVQSRRGFRKATYSAGTINIPAADPRGQWALSRAVVLHEVAHHLAGVAGHGREFRAALVHLYDRRLGAGARALLAHLFAPLEQLPEPVDPATEDDQVRRVSALLAKAESTSSSEEAEAYLAKAGLVAQRHSVDMALAALERRAAQPDSPTHRMLTIGEPRRALNKRLVSLMLVIGHAWGVRVDIGPGSTYVLVYGMPADLDRVESVFTTASSVMQAKAHDHVRAGRWRGTTYLPNDGSPPRPVTAALARSAFCLGFVSRLGSNLAEAAAAARRGEAGTGSPEADPAIRGRRVDVALRAREVAVTDYHRTASNAKGTWRGSASSAGSAIHSRRAGERAADEYGQHSVSGGRREIGA